MGVVEVTILRFLLDGENMCEFFLMVKIFFCTEWFKRFNDFKAKYPHLKVLLAIGEENL